MLPLTLLNASAGQPIVVELKSGENVNGTITACDTYMNVTLKDAVHTSADGATQRKMPEIYLRGIFIKYVRVPDSLLEKIRDERQLKREEMRAENRQEERKIFTERRKR